MAVTTEIKGTLVIGTPPNATIDVPIATILPPPTPGVFEFDYTQPDVNQAIKINIGDFLTWLGQALSVNIPVDDLPESLRALTIALLKFHLSTTGDFAIQIQIGTTKEGVWDPNWQPVGSLPLILRGIDLSCTNMSGAIDLVTGTGTFTGQAGALPTGVPPMATTA